MDWGIFIAQKNITKKRFHHFSFSVDSFEIYYTHNNLMVKMTPFSQDKVMPMRICQLCKPARILKSNADRAVHVFAQQFSYCPGLDFTSI
jgi:hypothetical protein